MASRSHIVVSTIVTQIVDEDASHITDPLKGPTTDASTMVDPVDVSSEVTRKMPKNTEH